MQIYLSTGKIAEETNPIRNYGVGRFFILVLFCRATRLIVANQRADYADSAGYSYRGAVLFFV